MELGWFCDYCAIEESKKEKEYFLLSGGDTSGDLEFCSPRCLRDWVIETYIIKD